MFILPFYEVKEAAKSLNLYYQTVINCGKPISVLVTLKDDEKDNVYGKDENIKILYEFSKMYKIPVEKIFIFYPRAFQKLISTPIEGDLKRDVMVLSALASILTKN